MQVNDQPFSSRDSAERLDSWKEIAKYLHRDVRTVQRWERQETLPVRRHVHRHGNTVYAWKGEIDEWFRQRSPSSVRGVPTTRAVALPENPPRYQSRLGLTTFNSQVAVADLAAILSSLQCILDALGTNVGTSRQSTMRSEPVAPTSTLSILAD